mgnify:CR=1 FL=1
MPDDLDIDEMTAGLGSVRVAPSQRTRPTRSLVDELDFRKKARQQRSDDLSVPAGELPPSQGQVQWDPRTLNQDPEWQAKYGGTRPAQGARSGVLYIQVIDFSEIDKEILSILEKQQCKALVLLC